MSSSVLTLINSDGVVDLQTPGNRENSIRAHLGQLLYETIKWGMNSDESQSEIEKRLVEDGQGRLSRMIESLERQTFDYIWFSKDLVAHVSVAAAPLALLVQRERGGQRRQLGLGRALRQVPINK